MLLSCWQISCWRETTTYLISTNILYVFLLSSSCYWILFRLSIYFSLKDCTFSSMLCVILNYILSYFIIMLCLILFGFVACAWKSQGGSFWETYFWNWPSIDRGCFLWLVKTFYMIWSVLLFYLLFQNKYLLPCFSYFCMLCYMLIIMPSLISVFIILDPADQDFGLINSQNFLSTFQDDKALLLQVWLLYLAVDQS